MKRLDRWGSFHDAKADQHDTLETFNATATKLQHRTRSPIKCSNLSVRRVYVGYGREIGNSDGVDPRRVALHQCTTRCTIL